MTGYTFILTNGTETIIRWDMLPAPEDVRSEETALTTIVPLPKRAIYRESHGRNIEEITLSGTFGLQPRQYKGELVTGTDLHKSFHQTFWVDYMAIQEQGSPEQKRNTKIEYHDWLEDKHYYVEPVRFVSPKGKDNKTFLRYDIGLRAYGEIQNKLLVEKPDKRLVANRAARALQHLAAKLKDADNYLRDKADKTASFLHKEVLTPTATLTDALFDFVAGRTTELQFPFRHLSNILTGINTTITEVDTLTTTPLTDAVNSLRNIKRQIRRLQATPEIFGKGFGQALHEIYEQHVDIVTGAESNEELDEKRGGENQRSRQYAQSIGSQTYRSTKTIETKQGDTLQKLAAKYLGDATRWQELAALNGIEYPFFSSDGVEGTIKYGKKILIPSTASTPGGSSIGDLGNDALANQESMTERLYGRDLKLVEEEGKLSIVFGANNDIETVAGEDNLLQAVKLKTKIAQGTLLENPAFGLRKLKGKRANKTDTLLLQHGLKVAAESDPRVKSVKVDIERTGNVTKVGYKIQPISTTTGRALESIVEDAG